LVLKHYTVAIWGFNKTGIELAHLEANSVFIHFEGSSMKMQMKITVVVKALVEHLGSDS
jgi:hypothetical protein